LDEVHSIQARVARRAKRRPNWVALSNERANLCALSLPTDLKLKYNKDQLALEAGCRFGGVWENALVHNCSMNGGASGGVLFYYDEDLDGGTYFALAVNSSNSDVDKPDGLKFSNSYFNTSAAIIPDF